MDENKQSLRDKGKNKMSNTQEEGVNVPKTSFFGQIQKNEKNRNLNFDVKSWLEKEKQKVEDIKIKWVKNQNNGQNAKIEDMLIKIQN